MFPGRDCQTTIWKGITNGLFQQSLDPIDPVVSEENISKFHSLFFYFLAKVAMLVRCLDCWIQFWKGTILWLFKQRLVPIGPVFSEMKIFKISFPFYIFSNSGHVGWRPGLPDTILEGDHPRTIPPEYGLNWPSGCRWEDFLVIVDGRTTDAKCWQKLTWPFFIRWAKKCAYYFLSMVKSKKKFMASTITS